MVVVEVVGALQLVVVVVMVVVVVVAGGNEAMGGLAIGGHLGGVYELLAAILLAEGGALGHGLGGLGLVVDNGGASTLHGGHATVHHLHLLELHALTLLVTLAADGHAIRHQALELVALLGVVGAQRHQLATVDALLRAVVLAHLGVFDEVLELDATTVLTRHLLRHTIGVLPGDVAVAV